MNPAQLKGRLGAIFRDRRVRLALVVTALLAAGYLLGAAGAPSEGDAAAQRHSAERSSFLAARAGAQPRAEGRGRRAGLAAGRRQGRERGARAGAHAGLVAVRAARRALRLSGRAESRADLGGTGASGLDLGGADLKSLDLGNEGVLVVGDSLEVLTAPYLARYLPTASLTINAKGGYSSLQIFELFRRSYDPSQSVVVFDAGTNDNPAYPEILAGRLQAVASAVGDRCMVVPTIHGLAVGGVGSAAKNRVVRAFAASRPGTQVPDWAGAVASHPELMADDNLHPLPAGADLRARLIAQGVAGCVASGFAPGRP